MNQVILHLIISWKWRKHADAAFKRVHTLIVFMCARAGVRVSFGARDLELRFANKRATSLPGDDETEYSENGHPPVTRPSGIL